MDTSGLSVTLRSKNDFSFTAGDPIIYKGFGVGKIEDIYFNNDENVMYYNAFIEAPYHTLIRTNTRFWKISGIELKVSANGVKVQAGTLETIIRGGVTFGLPENEILGEMVAGRGYFDIYSNEQMVIDEQYEHFVEYVLLVKDSIRGLVIGAPVEFHGVRIGNVAQTNVVNQTGTSLLDKHALIPVLIRLEPGRMGLSDDEAGVEKVKTDIKKWVAEGLKASLATGNFITGSQLIELAYHSQAKSASLAKFQQYSAIPLVPNKYSRIEIKISALLNKLNKLPVNSVASKAESVLVETKKTLTKLQKLPIESMVNNADQAFIKADKMIESLTKSATILEQVLQATEEKDLPKSMDKALRSINAILLDLKPLILNLKNKPNSLIFSGQKTDEIAPKKGQ